MTTGQSERIDSVLQETRVFPPPPEFARQAHIRSLEQYRALWQEAAENPEGFWGRMAEELHWFSKWKRVLEWNPPFAQWFVGGTLNIADNCLDRHLAGPRRTKAAIIWEGEPGDQRVLTYQMLHR